MKYFLIGFGYAAGCLFAVALILSVKNGFDSDKSPKMAEPKSAAVSAISGAPAGDSRPAVCPTCGAVLPAKHPVGFFDGDGWRPGAPVQSAFPLSTQWRVPADQLVPSSQQVSTEQRPTIQK